MNTEKVKKAGRKALSIATLEHDKTAKKINWAADKVAGEAGIDKKNIRLPGFSPEDIAQRDKERKELYD